MFKIVKEDKTSIIKSLRIPQDLLTKIEDVCSKNNITFTNFIIQASIYALENISED